MSMADMNAANVGYVNAELALAKFKHEIRHGLNPRHLVLRSSLYSLTESQVYEDYGVCINAFDRPTARELGIPETEDDEWSCCSECDGCLDYGDDDTENCSDPVKSLDGKESWREFFFAQSIPPTIPIEPETDSMFVEYPDGTKMDVTNISPWA